MTTTTPPIITPEQWDRCVAAVDQPRVTGVSPVGAAGCAQPVIFSKITNKSRFTKVCWAFPNIHQTEKPA